MRNITNQGQNPGHLFSYTNRSSPLGSRIKKQDSIWETKSKIEHRFVDIARNRDLLSRFSHNRESSMRMMKLFQTLRTMLDLSRLLTVRLSKWYIYLRRKQIESRHPFYLLIIFTLTFKKPPRCQNDCFFDSSQCIKFVATEIGIPNEPIVVVG